MKNDFCPTLHKICDHPDKVLERLPDTLRISMLSEEPIEGNHQFILDDSLHHARQTSRHDRLFDVFHRDMDRSDPILLSYFVKSRLAQRPKNEVPEHILALMVDPTEGNLDDILNSEIS